MVELALEDGGSILVEVDARAERPVTRGRSPAETVTTVAGESLEGVLGRLGPALKGVVSELRRSADWPDQVVVEFAVKLSADANVIIARTAGEANFRVALTWTQGGR